MSYVANIGILDTTVQRKPETQNIRKLVDASGSLVSAPAVFNSTRVTSNRATVASVTAETAARIAADSTLTTSASTNATNITNNTNQALLLAATDPESLIHGTVTTTNASGLITSAPVVWPDTATGTLTQTANATRPSLADSYVVTHVLSGTTKTYTQSAVTRDASGNITVIPAIVVS